MSLLSVWRVIEALLLSTGMLTSPRLALHYGERPPLHALRAFDWVVLEPEHVTDEGLSDLRRAEVTPLAYLSVGEAHRSRPYFARLPSAWKLGKPTVWGAVVMDPAAAGWRDLLLQEALALRARGFEGLFLDTLDSYEGELRTEPERAARAQALVGWLRELRRRWPGAKVVLNRGFALFPGAAPLVNALLAESLFAGYDASHDRYHPVSEADRRWLLPRLQEIHDRYHLPVVVVDYVPSRERERAREVARQIAALGFVPWVAPGHLDRLGVGTLESVPRRILVVYDGRNESVSDSSAHRLMALPLEYLGYAVDYMDAATPLPGFLGDEYAGVVSWLIDEDLPHGATYRAWLLRQIDDGVPLAVLGCFGFEADKELLARLGLSGPASDPRPPYSLAARDALVGFEDQPSSLERVVPPIRVVSPAVTAHLTFKDSAGAAFHPVVTGPWGGMARDPFAVTLGAADRTRWIIEPFAFVTRALHLAPIPALDVTTENGRRLLMVHIDGDGYLNLAEHPRHPYAAELMLEEVLARYPLPTTVSVIEGDVGPQGLYPEQSRRLEAIARRIFALPHVEAASHTFSHPFDWLAAETGGPARRHEQIHLPIPGYKFDLHREIAGSAAYIDRRLLPPGKRTRVLLWSGSAEPTEAAVRESRLAGLYNFNGGSARVDTAAIDSITEVTALARPVGRELQIYAQAQNENNYTNLWHGPFYGFRRVIGSFEQSERPRRLKPIDVYYHYYSAAKPGGLVALKQVYDWVLHQETLPLFISEYAERAEDFYQATLARTLDGSWRWKGLRSLRTVRFDETIGWPDPSSPSPLASARQLPQGRYATFVGGYGQPLEVRFRPERPGVPHLAWSNAPVTTVAQHGHHLSLGFAGHVPVRGALAECPGAQVHALGRSLPVTVRDGLAEFALGAASGTVQIECRAPVVAQRRSAQADALAP